MLITPPYQVKSCQMCQPNCWGIWRMSNWLLTRYRGCTAARFATPPSQPRQWILKFLNSWVCYKVNIFRVNFGIVLIKVIARNIVRPVISTFMVITNWETLDNWVTQYQYLQASGKYFDVVEKEVNCDNLFTKSVEGWAQSRGLYPPFLQELVSYRNGLALY